MAEGGQLPVDEVVTTVRLLAQARSGRLVAIVVAVPLGTPVVELVSEVRESLRRAGFGLVEVVALPRTGPLRVLSMEFTR